MRFAYQEYEVEASATLPGGVLYRPEVPLDVIGTSRSRGTLALLDTGADETVIPVSFVPRLGIRLEASATGRARSAGGHDLELRAGRVTFAVTDGHQQCRWTALVSFLEFERPEDEVVLLGHAGFLEFFTAVFDGERREVELIANKNLPVGL